MKDLILITFLENKTTVFMCVHIRHMIRGYHIFALSGGRWNQEIYANWVLMEKMFKMHSRDVLTQEAHRGI